MRWETIETLMTPGLCLKKSKGRRSKHRLSFLFVCKYSHVYSWSVPVGKCTCRMLKQLVLLWTCVDDFLCGIQPTDRLPWAARQGSWVSSFLGWCWNLVAPFLMIHLEIEEEPWTHRDPALISLFALGRWSTLTSVLVQLGDATTRKWKLLQAANQRTG